jgi:hypothetical protein
MIDCGIVLKINKSQAENDGANKEFKKLVPVDHSKKKSIGLN